MESRTRKRPSMNNNEDRISTLPNVLIHHILSFLDTLQVVQTCVLSRRWMNVWKSHPYLDFNYDTFSSIIESDYDNRMIMFTDFINQVLVRRNNFKIFKLCFDCCDDPRHSLVESLIYYAVKHHVEEIYVNVSCDSPIVLPRCFFNCESLTSLKLNVGEEGLALSRSLGLPSLKTLHLGGIESFDGKSFSSCPNLEGLTIEDIGLYGIESFNIHAPNLKKLEILNWRSNDSMDQCKVMIFAPKLTNFKFDGNAPIAWSEVNLSSLDDVNVNLWTSFPSYYDSDEDELEPEHSVELLNLIKMLSAFHNAKSLTLSMNIIMVLSKVPATLNEHPSPFTNLKYLKLKPDGMDVTVPAYVLNYFLRSSSLLKICF